MSKWLKSVNNLLDKLDDRVETADVAAKNVVTQLLAGSGGRETDSEEDDSSYDDDDEEEEEEESSEEEEEEIKFEQEEEEEPSQEVAPTAVEEKEEPNRDPPPPAAAPELVQSFPPAAPKPPPPPPPRPPPKKVAAKNNKNEFRELQQQNALFQKELNAARTELQAQQKELLQAADRMQHDRTHQKEELDLLEEEHEEELTHLTSDFQQQLTQQKQDYEKQLQDLRELLQTEAQKRQEEGGDWTKELQDTLVRERNGLKELNVIKEEKLSLQNQIVHLQTQLSACQKQVTSLQATANTATERELKAEEKLDIALSQHKRQVQQRQERETLLEQRIAEMGAALAAQHPKAPPTQPELPQVLLLADESKLALVTQQCEALQHELAELSRERAAEAVAFQERQHEHETGIQTLNAHIQRLEVSLLRETTKKNAMTTPLEDPQTIQTLTDELHQVKRQVSAASEQLMRQKTLVDATKTEIVTLKGRLESATLRAETAENALVSTPRRRVRGRPSLPSRTLRNTLGMQVAHGSVGTQIAMTIDALDTWMLETGTILRHEPLARLGFAAYLGLMHLWCFALVFFHAVQSEHGDLGNLSLRRGRMIP
jgi:hypothetical protein